MQHEEIYHVCANSEIESGVTVTFKKYIYVIILGTWLISGANAEEATIGIDDSVLGDTVAMDLEFYDEKGEVITLAEASEGKPTVLALVYYNCTSICNPFLNAIVDVVNQSPEAFLPGDKYNIVAVSFDPEEKADLAAEKKESYFNQFERDNPIPAPSFRFLTGDSANIRTLTESVGFLYDEDGQGGFMHASSIIILSPSGVISRYIRGLSFLPVEIMVSVTNAMEGKWAPTIKKIVKFCFAEEPDGRGYYFDFLKVTGVLILLSIITTTLVLTVIVKRKAPAKAEPEE